MWEGLWVVRDLIAEVLKFNLLEQYYYNLGENMDKKVLWECFSVQGEHVKKKVFGKNIYSWLGLMETAVALIGVHYGSLWDITDMWTDQTCPKIQYINPIIKS